MDCEKTPGNQMTSLESKAKRLVELSDTDEPSPWILSRSLNGDWPSVMNSLGDELFIVTHCGDAEKTTRFLSACDPTTIREVASAVLEMREALSDLVVSATTEATEKGSGGYHLARLSDARACLAKHFPEAK